MSVLIQFYPFLDLLDLIVLPSLSLLLSSSSSSLSLSCSCLIIDNRLLGCLSLNICDSVLNNSDLVNSDLGVVILSDLSILGVSSFNSYFWSESEESLSLSASSSLSSWSIIMSPSILAAAFWISSLNRKSFYPESSLFSMYSVKISGFWL